MDMKLCRSSLFILLIFSAFFAEAQMVKDTTINGRPFVIHVIQLQETLYGISREYNAELNEIVVHNPSVIQGLKTGTRLLVPLQKERGGQSKTKSKILSVFKKKVADEFSHKPVVVLDTVTFKMALLLPFYLDMNDTLEVHNETKLPTTIYPKSRTALDYYSGIQLALDTIARLGYSVDVKVLDVSNDSVYNALLDSTILDDRQLILGPLHVRQFNRLAQRYGSDSNRVLVSPLSYKSPIGKYTNTYQLIPLPKMQLDTIVSVLKTKHLGKHVVIIGREEDENLIKHLKINLLSEPNQIRYKHYIFKAGELPEKELLYEVLDERENIVLIPSNNRSFVSRVLPMLGSMEDTSFTVYGLDSWNRFDNLDMDDLVNLNVHIPSALFPAPIALYQDFVFYYYQRYNAYPSKYAFAAYKQMLFFVTEEFSKMYSFSNPESYPGYLNTEFPLIHYQDYKQHLVK